MPGSDCSSKLQPDLIKIDMELLRDIHLSRAKQAIVAGIVGIARALDIHVLAEGVENDAGTDGAARGRHLAVPGISFCQACIDGASGRSAAHEPGRRNCRPSVN